MQKEKCLGGAGQEEAAGLQGKMVTVPMVSYDWRQKLHEFGEILFIDNKLNKG
jgi:hypothetical protein